MPLDFYDSIYKWHDHSKRTHKHTNRGVVFNSCDGIMELSIQFHKATAATPEAE